MNLLACHAEGEDSLDAVEAWAQPAVVPAAIGPFEVLGLLGQGGMGVVYRARRQDGGSATGPAPVIALKVLRAGVFNDQLKRRFQREIEVLRRLDHPGIARLLDAGTADGVPYLATEFVDGLTLGRWRHEVNAPLAERVRVLADLCDAVQAAHGHGVVHRDLKPENIIVTPDGRPMVLDFGIARLQDDRAPLATLATQTWQLLGTIRYMSPEQAAGGAAAIDARTDIYTLGVIAYELLSGTLPYNLSRLSTPRALLEITTAEPLPLGGRDGALDLIVQHALAKDPTRRYATAAAMADDLRRYLDGRPISLRRPGPVARLRRALRARPRIRRAVLVLAIATTAAGITLATMLNQPSLAPNWDTVFARIEEGDVLRHNGPHTRENWEAAIAQFKQARVELTQLPRKAYTDDLNRYVKWRLGELYYFIGGLEHDAVLIDQARGYWRDATLTAWTPGSATAIDERMAARANVLHLGAHHAESGVAMAHISLAALESPVSNLTEAFAMHDRAANTLGDGSRAYHDGIVPPSVRLESRAFAQLNRGGALTALGAAIDSLAVIDRGLVALRAAAALDGLTDSAGLSTLAEAFGLAYLRRAELLPAEPAITSLDSAQVHLDRAADLNSLASGRNYWQLFRTRARLWEQRAELARTGTERRRYLLEATRELERSLTPLRERFDDFERALSRFDLAGVAAQLAAIDGDRAGFARADSLLALDTIFGSGTRYPLQHAERALRFGQIRRLEWAVFGDPNDSTEAMVALLQAHSAVPAMEYPALHRRLSREERQFARRGR
jgi:serine/threonine protein kinase